jgi:ATP-binding cassette, subfamily C (CFTR/MRP), member 1
MLSSKQKIWNAAIQRRVAMTSSMLSSMKSVKMLGLAGFMSKSIQGQRIRELNLAKEFRWLNLWVSVIGEFPGGYYLIINAN